MITSNPPDVAMSTAVCDLLVANSADADCFCATSTEKRASEKLINGTAVYLARGEGYPYNATSHVDTLLYAIFLVLKLQVPLP